MATEVETKERISESPSGGAAVAIDKSSISNETAKDEASCTVAVGTLDSSKGEILVEAPKETVSKHGEIVSEELKNEGDLTNNGNNTEAKGEKVTAAKELAESESSDVNVMAIDKERATDESASQNRLQQKDQDQDDNIVHAQVTKFDMVEVSEAQAEDKEDEGTTDIEKLEVNGDNINKEAGNGMLSDESTNGIDNTPTVEPLEMKNTKEPHENKDIEPADKLESSIDAVREEPDVEQLERVYEDKHIKVEAETGIFNDERTNGIDCVSVEEPSEKGNMQESDEKTSKEELEAAKDEPEHDKLKSFLEPKVEKLGRVNEDNVKIEGEPEICAEERIDDADSMSVAEPSDKEIRQEPLEITAKEDPELAKDEPEHGKLESSLDPVAHELEEKELERVYEDMNAQVEAENGICDNKRTTGTDSISEAEPSDKENRQEPLEMTAEENLEPEKDEPEHEKLEKSLDAITREPEKKLERVIEDKKIKMEAETEICDDERTADADGTPVLEPSEKENRQEPIEITAKEDLEPVEDVPEHSEPESSLDAVLQKPEASTLPDNGPETSGLNRNHENETMSKEDLVMTLEECSAEDEKKYEPIEEPIEKKAVNFQPEYENSMTELGTETAMENGTVTASKFNEKNEDTVDDFTVTQEIILETIKGVEMHETAISEELIHDADDNIEQIRRETEAENLTKISETAAFKDQSNNKIADAETTNFISDDCANQKKELDTLCTSEVSVEENIENVIDAEKSTEQSSEKVDDNESNERCTQGIHELEIENAIHDSIEDTDNMDSIFKAEQTSKKITGVSLNTEQMGNEKVNEGSEVNQQKDPSEEVADSVISSDVSSTEQGPNHDPKEGSGEDHLKIDTIRCEKIIITEHNAFADDIEEKNHVDKQENFKKMDEVESVLEGTTANADNSSCKADDKDEKVRDDNNRNDGGEELEDASNLICENQAHETVNGEGNIEVISSNEKTSKEFELVSELVPELKSQETRTETEGTPIEKSNFDENSCHKNIKTSNLTKETEPANEESGTSNNDVLEETIDEDNQEGTITSFEELDESGTKKMHGAAGLNKDAETAKEKGEENLNTAKEDCSDDHTSIAPILPDQIGEPEDSSKTEYGEQIYLVINDKCNIEIDIHKEMVDPEEFEKITEPISKDHNQGDVNKPKSTDNLDNTDHLGKTIPEITAHSDDPETAKVRDEDVLEKDFSYKCDDQELVPGAADCEDNKEASVQERKENLDMNMELGPEDLRQDVICETESVKVEKKLDIDENVRTEYTTDATSGAKLEETSVGDSYELESDDKQENTNMFEIREEEMPKEETAGHTLEKTLSTVHTNTTEDISENQIQGKDGANNANSEIIGCEKNQATEEEIPEVANRDQNKESYEDDRTKNGTTSDEVKVSDTSDVAKNLTETVVQISEDASQVMKVDAYECQDYEENGECKENTNTSQLLEKRARNENEEKTNEIHDDLVVISIPPDEATYGNLHKKEGETATKEGYGTGDGIANQEANEYEDGELKDKVTVSDNSVSDIPALDEVTGQVESARQKAADLSCEEQIHESISISEGANLDAFIIENKTEQKSYESNGESESNENVSFKETTANDSEKEKLEDSEPEKSTHAVLEDLEITIGAEGIHESETNNESTKNNNEENFLKDRDMKLVESAIELEPDHQNNKSIYPTEGVSPSEEALNVKDLVDDIAKEEAHNEEKNCGDDDVSVAHNLVEESTDMEGEEPHLQKERMELETHGKTEQNECIVAQNEEIAEKSETLKLHKDTKELIKQSSNTLLGSQEIATPIKNIEKNIMPDEDASEADLEQIPDYETEAKESSEQVTDIVPNDEVKEDDHQTSKELVMDSTENLITSANTVFQAEETKQGVGEQFSKISDYWPRGYNEEASMVNTVDAEHPKETMSVVEQPEAEQITHTSTDSTAACETEEQGEEVYLPEDSGLDTIYKEGREELKEVTDSMPKEVDKKIGSSVELTEDRENPHEESAVQESQVTETEELTDKAGHEVEVANLQEEKQQTGLGDLPVSQFLMKYILQEEGDVLNEAHDGEIEDVSDKQNDGDKQNEGKIPKQEGKSAPLSVVQLIEETSTPEDKVGSKKLEDSSESVQAEEGYEGKENSDITVFKDGPSLQSTPDESTSSLVVTEDGKDEIDTLSSEMSNNIARDESMEVNSTEQNSQGSAVYNEHCKPDLVQDEKIKGTVLEENLTQEEIQKDNETHDKEVDVSTFGKTSEEDNLQKERGEESKECLQDVVKAEGSYEVSDGQSTMDDSEYGEILEIKSEIEKVECGDEKQEVGNQVQILKNDSTEELTLSEPQIIQQIDIVNDAKIHALETAEKSMEDKNSANSLDRKQVVEAKVDENKADEEKHEKEEKEEFKPEKFSSNAAIVETKESKPTEKCEQTRKSSESTTTEGHELEETLHLHSEVKIVESGEKKQDAVNQNQVQMNNGLNEEEKEEKLSDSATQPLQMAEKLEEQSSVANVDENHAVQTTETKVDENKAGDEKDEEEEDEHDPEESGQNSTINVESRDAELKPAPKKSHGILSGVGSKVKHSIAKVKKAITGKSSHSKTVSAK